MLIFWRRQWLRRWRWRWRYPNKQTNWLLCTFFAQTEYNRTELTFCCVVCQHFRTATATEAKVSSDWTQDNNVKSFWIENYTRKGKSQSRIDEMMIITGGPADERDKKRQVNHMDCHEYRAIVDDSVAFDSYLVVVATAVVAELCNDVVNDVSQQTLIPSRFHFLRFLSLNSYAINLTSNHAKLCVNVFHCNFNDPAHVPNDMVWCATRAEKWCRTYKQNKLISSLLSLRKHGEIKRKNNTQQTNSKEKVLKDETTPSK